MGNQIQTFRSREEQIYHAFNLDGEQFTYLDYMDKDNFRAALIEAEQRGYQKANNSKETITGQEPVGYLSETAMKEITSGGHEGVNLRKNPGSEEFQKSWGKDIPLYINP